MSSDELVIDTGDGPMPLYEARPSGEPKGAILVIQEAFGVTNHIQSVARRFADEGWLAVAPAMYHRQGSPVLSYEDIPAVLPFGKQLTSTGVSADVEAALGHVERAGFTGSQVGIVGYCMGGTVAFFAALEHALGGAVGYYGGGIVDARWGYPSQLEAAADLRTPYLGLFGDLDPGIPPDQVELLREAVKAARVQTEIVRYSEAGHGFNCDARPAHYNADAASDGWKRTLSWFDTYVG